VQNLQYELDHTVEFTINGFVKSIDKIRITNTGAATQSLPPVTIGYPVRYGNNSLETVVSSPFEITLSRNNTAAETFVTLTFEGAPSISPGAHIEVSVSTVYGKILELTGGNAYQVLLTVIPSFRPRLDFVNSTLRFPTGSSLTGEIFGMTPRSTSEGLIVNGLFVEEEANIPRTLINIVNMPQDVKIVRMEYAEARRVIRISTDLSVTVSDTIVVTNLDSMAVEKLRFAFLEPTGSTVTFGPSVDPPLARPRQTGHSRGEVNLLTGLGTSVTDSRTLTFSYESSILKDSERGSHVVVPLTPPIDGLVSEYEIEVEADDGVELAGEDRIRIVNASSVDSGSISFSVRPKAFWASWSGFPVASVLFVISLLVGVTLTSFVQKGGMPGRGKPAGTGIGPLVEEKIGEVSQILEELRDPDASKLGPNDISQARRSIESVRSIYSSRVGEFSRQLHLNRPDLAGRMKEMTDLDKEYDKAVSDYLTTIDRYVARKSGPEVFRQQASAHSKRVRRLGESLLSSATDIQRLTTS
jgi:hypothetical protein